MKTAPTRNQYSQILKFSPVVLGINFSPLADWTGNFFSCVATQLTDTDGNGYWVWEADFPVEVHGGSAGYTISSQSCRWDFAQQKYFCRFSAREGTQVVQSLTVGCPGCKPVIVAVQASADRKGTTCVQK